MDHHYLPQFYLRQWTAPNGRTVRYRWVAPGRIVEDQASPRGTGFEPDLYATPPAMPWETYDPHSIETKLMSPIDNDAALVLQKLVSGDPNNQLTAEEQGAWALFLNSLLHRHRDEILHRDAVAPEIARSVIDDLNARYSDEADRTRFAKALEDVDLNQMARTAHRSLMAQAIKDPAAKNAIDRLAWQVIGINPSMPLITTDRPLLVNPGFERPSLELMTIALSPTRLFVAYPREWITPDGTLVEGTEECLESIVFAHDLLLLMQPCRFVFASKKLDDQQMVDAKLIRMRTAVEQALTQWANLDSASTQR